MKYKRIRSPFKYHGSKDPIAGEIVELMKEVEHLTYMEPYCGAASVLLAKDPSNTSEIANDVYEDIYDFFSVLRNRDDHEELVRLCELTPFSEATWRRAQEILESEGASQVERAHAFYVSIQQSRQGLQKDFATSSKTRTRGGRNEQVNAYFSGVNRLPEIHERLQNVMFFNRDALKMVESQDLDSRLIYADPPYVPETRTSRNAYLHEMSSEDHHHLVDAFLASKSKIMLSGYPGSEEIYKRLEDVGWGVWRRGVAKHSSSRKLKPKTFEQIWATSNSTRSMQKSGNVCRHQTTNSLSALAAQCRSCQVLSLKATPTVPPQKSRIQFRGIRSQDLWSRCLMILPRLHGSNYALC